MKISEWNLEIVKKVAKLLKVKSRLQGQMSRLQEQIEKINTELDSLEEKETELDKIGKIRLRIKNPKNPELEQKILEALRSAGDEGLTAKEISEKTGLSVRSIAEWLIMGIRRFGVKKVGGRWVHSNHSVHNQQEEKKDLEKVV
ncbi:winged helix-turn-helix transcriptional regulator [Candidatus Methylacidiphilum infernorum]|uniref:Uncharacterized protein n=1 Tax=Methylacidiphilum infernorum (isolate V4) TaxID=481448 RepID=B3DXJ0_METI4|nr:winged helix-turn-helix transcriptional regulator [Candidatus Methylacidiphilum infernorum]ACD82224.1 Hypothetical protein Minf_0164 [Methylacidiphilum infernorum V4]